MGLAEGPQGWRICDSIRRDMPGPAGILPDRPILNNLRQGLPDRLPLDWLP